MPNATPRIIQRTLPRAPYYYPGGDKTGDTLPMRRVTRLVTDPLDVTTGLVKGVVALPGTAGGFLLSVQAYDDLWLRLYTTAADRENDFGRAITDEAPSTPCILDVLLQKTDILAPYGKTTFGPGPGDADPSAFGYLLDGRTDNESAGNSWDTGHAQEIGDALVVDFGTPLTLSAFEWETDQSTHYPPDAVSIAISNDGDYWNVLVPSQTDLVWDEVINFTSPITTRYLRVQITAPHSGTGSGDSWNITNIEAYPWSDDALYLRVTNEEEDGIPAFNFDDPANPGLYYTVMADPFKAFSLFYENGFGGPKCGLRAWFPVPTSNPGTYGPWDYSYGNCYLTEFLPSPGIPVLGTTSSKWPVAYINGPLLKTGGNAQFQFGIVAASVTDCAASLVCQYGDDGNGANQPSNKLKVIYWQADSDWTNAPRLLAGLETTGGGGFTTVGWVDSDGTEHTLASGTAFSDVSRGAGFTLDVTFGTGEDASTTVTVACSLGGSCTATVPSALLSLGQNGVGLELDTGEPSDALDAWQGIGVQSIAIAGGSGQATLDIGYTPIEAPGGTLKGPI